MTITGKKSTPPTILEYLDGFIAGHLTVEELSAALQAQVRANPEDAWEVLSVADQYFRRGKISAEAYDRVKSTVAAGRMVAERSGPIDPAPLVAVPPPIVPLKLAFFHGRLPLKVPVRKLGLAAIH